MANIKPINNKKGVAYQVDIRVKGYKRIWKTFKGTDSKLVKKAAEKWAADIEEQMYNGTYREPNSAQVFCDARDKIETVEELINYFRVHEAPVRYKDNAPKYDCMYDWWIDELGQLKIWEVTSSMVSACKEKLRTEPFVKGLNKNTGKPIYALRGNSTVNKYIFCFSAVMKYAVNELEKIEVNPCSRVRKMPKPKSRNRIMQPAEIALFSKACLDKSEMLLLFFVLLLSSSGRYSEVLKLQVETIDFKNNRLIFLDTKNKTSRGVGIESVYMEFLKYYLKKNNIESGYIFINKRSGKLWYIRGQFLGIIKELGLEDFHIHDLRHTGATTVVENGGQILELTEILGHKSMAMSRRYTHLTQKHTDEVLKKAMKTIDFGIDFSKLFES